MITYVHDYSKIKFIYRRHRLKQLKRFIYSFHKQLQRHDYFLSACWVLETLMSIRQTQPLLRRANNLEGRRKLAFRELQFISFLSLVSLILLS